MHGQIKIFITGGTGFIGRHLINELSADYEIFILVNEKSEHQEIFFRNVTFVKGDILSISDNVEIISKCKYFIHLAGEKSDESLMGKINVEGLDKILQVVSEFPDIRFIHFSSTGVFGIVNQKTRILFEDSSCFPSNIYEKTKLKSETVLREFSEKKSLKYIILRPSNVIGENDKSLKLLNLFRSVKKNRIIFLCPDACVNYVYVGYLSSIVRFFLENDHFDNEIYNLNSPCNITSFVEMIKTKMGVDKKTLFVPAIFRPVFRIIALFFDMLPSRFQVINSPKYLELTNKVIFSDKKISGLVGFGSGLSLENGLGKLIDHYKEKGYI